MGSYLGIVSQSDLTNVVNENGGWDYNSQTEIVTFRAVYEAGAESSLRDMAILKWLELEYPSSQHIDVANERLSKVIQRLEDSFSEIQQGLYLEYESELNGAQEIEGREFYIAGFIAGYRLLKTIQSSYKGPL
jgi:hypothetical protein